MKPPASGEKVLLAQLEPSDQEAIATWEARVLLPKGSYRFSATVACDQPIFRGPDCPVRLKVCGGVDQQFESDRNDPQHLDVQQGFAIQSGASGGEEILIQCQVQSKELSVGFEFGAMVLRRVE